MRVPGVLAVLFVTGCAQAPAQEEEITYSSSWFSCKSRFNCVVVYDAFCQLKAVNKRYSLIYQDWSLQEVIRHRRMQQRVVDHLGDVAEAVRHRFQGVWL